MPFVVVYDANVLYPSTLRDLLIRIAQGTKVGTFTLEKDHGYIFEVFPTAPDRQSPKPIKASGRAPHEAVVIEPSRPWLRSPRRSTSCPRA